MDERQATVLIVEDNSANRELLVELLGEATDFRILEAEDARTGFSLFTQEKVDLVLLDVMLPDESGLNLCRRMKSVTRIFVPIILVTALNDVSDKVMGLEAGADDFLSKPILREELLARTKSHLRTKRMMDRIDRYRSELSLFNQRLQEQVDIRTRQLQSALAELRRAKEDVERTRVEIVERLGIAAEYRDEWTGHHIRRMALYVGEISLACGLPAERAELFQLVAPLHDIGKMGVRDHVLLKPEQLEEGEVDLIREHTRIGAQILAEPRTELIAVALEMARHHHERWDGRGYPDGLKGEDIPLSARICSVADVFDALTSSRVYRADAFQLQEARRQIMAGAGTRFDPRVTEAFARAFDRIQEIWEQPR
jgi:putative two-component system response regulator